MLPRLGDANDTANHCVANHWCTSLRGLHKCFMYWKKALKTLDFPGVSVNVSSHKGKFFLATFLVFITCTKSASSYLELLHYKSFAENTISGHVELRLTGEKLFTWSGGVTHFCLFHHLLIDAPVLLHKIYHWHAERQTPVYYGEFYGIAVAIIVDLSLQHRQDCTIKPNSSSYG